MSGPRKLIWPSVMVSVMIVWSTFYPIIKYMVKGVDPLVLSFFRYFLGFIPLTPFFIKELKRQPEKPSAKEAAAMGILGFTGITLFSVGLFYGIKLSTAANGALLTNTQPIFTAILGPFLISEVMSGKKILGIIIGIAGVALVVTGGNFHTLAFGGDAVAGNLLLIGASVSLSVYSILIKKYAVKFGSLIPTWISMVSGTLFICIINIVRNQSITQVLQLPPLSLLMIIYLGFIGTSLTYFAFNLALVNMPVTSATSYKMLIPVSGMILAVSFLGERPGLPTIAGVFIVILSVFIIQREPAGKLRPGPERGR